MRAEPGGYREITMMVQKNNRSPKNDDRKEDPRTGQEEKDYYFLREVIKEKPLDKKKLAVRAGGIVAGAVLFGVVAAFVFAKTEPVFREEEPAPRVTIPEEEPTASPTPEVTQEPTPQQEAVDDTPQLEDFQEMFDRVMEVAEEPEKSLVSVQGFTSGEEWLAEGGSRETISGLLAADNGREYFILTEYRVVADVDRILVTFQDGSTVDANFQKQDPNTGLAVLKIAKADVDNETKDQIEVAELGSSYSVSRGTPVLALGSPAGYGDSVAWGMVTSVTNTKATVDAEYHLLTTDIMGDKQGSGILVNLDGEIVGIIAQSFSIEDDKNVVTALPISELKDLIEKLSNNEDLIYLGVTGQDIGSELSEKTGIPKGVYVNAVSEDSPAMEAGIQNGDVIVRIGSSEVATLKQLKSALDSCQPGRRVQVAAMRKGAEGYVEIVFDVTPGAL